MPIYEYQCQECGELIEVLQKLSDAPLTDCPACGKAALKKKVSAAAFRLKGGGWYETDFKTGSKKNLLGGDKSEGGSSEGGKAGDSGGAKGGDSKDNKDSGGTGKKESKSEGNQAV